MSRASWAPVALFMIGGISAFGYSCATRTDAERPELNGKSLPVQRPKKHTVDAALPPQQVIPRDFVTKLIADATTDDSKTRAAAILALSGAPKSRAVPVLRKILNAGEPMERQLALRSLHALALKQGDADGGIRDVLRLLIYDGGDEEVAQGAQVILDDLMERIKTVRS